MLSPAGPTPAQLPGSLEVLDDEPAALRRPLALADGRAYAATWLLVRYQRALPVTRARPAPIVVQPTAVSETPAPPDAHPSLARLDQPAEVETLTERRLYVIRDDGIVFGDGADAPPGDLGLAPQFPEPPRLDRLWRRAAVQRYRDGQRLDAADLFARLVACYDRFVDFERSLADQRTMCELCACLSLATWLADAFPVFPYLWIAGERGSGKSQLGTVWALTSYLGEVVLAGGSYPALRDLAELGAALYFDDAEALAGGRGDVFKRELLLAGNRRGAQVPLKTLHGDRWRTRWVSAYTPRAFSAIAPPDPTLASRAVVVSLARTLDPTRGQRDPADAVAWPCDRLALQDDCWAFALSHLAASAEAWRALERETALIGRDFEKWRPVLAVASLLAAEGVAGLADRLRAVMLAYDHSASELGGPDETLEVVEALVYCAEYLVASAIARVVSATDIAAFRRRPFQLSNSALLDGVRTVAPDGSLAARSDRSAASRIGRIMLRLRFVSERATSLDRARGFKVRVDQIVQVARAYGVPTRLELPLSPTP